MYYVLWTAEETSITAARRKLPAHTGTTTTYEFKQLDEKAQTDWLNECHIPTREASNLEENCGHRPGSIL
jgi:hypothetical protein